MTPYPHVSLRCDNVVRSREKGSFGELVDFYDFTLRFTRFYSEFYIFDEFDFTKNFDFSFTGMRPGRAQDYECVSSTVTGRSRFINSYPIIQKGYENEKIHDSA